MAVQEYLDLWNLTQLSDRFGDTTFINFLGMSKTAALTYGKDFANRHGELCEQIRTVLYSKRLTDNATSKPNSDVLALSKAVETMCVTRNGKTRKVTSSKSEPSIMTRLGPIPLEHMRIKDRLGRPVERRPRRNRHVRRTRYCSMEHGIDGFRKNLNVIFEEMEGQENRNTQENMNTPFPTRRPEPSVPRVPVKHRLGVRANNTNNRGKPKARKILSF